MPVTVRVIKTTLKDSNGDEHSFDLFAGNYDVEESDDPESDSTDDNSSNG